MKKTTEIHIYRIIQESIGNAVKHAMPKLITIESHTSDGMHIFSVTDDGKGFTLEEALQHFIGHVGFHRELIDRNIKLFSQI